jgi:hypothetical protein
MSRRVAGSSGSGGGSGWAVPVVEVLDCRGFAPNSGAFAGGGEIPFDQPGRHRRVRLADVLAYQERARRRRAAGLDQMVADAEGGELYDLPDAPFERLPVSGQ